MQNDHPTLYSVQEAAEKTGLTTYTLRYYESEGLLPSISRVASSGHRRYTDDDLRLLHFLRRMRDTGMPIRQMKQYVALIMQGDSTIDARLRILIEHRAVICEHIAQLNEHIGAIDQKIENYQQLTDEYSPHMLHIQDRKQE